jgi:type II secretory pathway pseudopilin PulG
MKTHEGGFTLIDVLVALAVGGLVIVAAHRIFAGVGDSSRAIAAAREHLDRQANARRWLKSAYLSLEPPFEGRTDRMSFSSWQLSSGGWFEPRVLTVSRAGDQLVAEGAAGTVVLREGVTDVAFDYLLEPGADTKWVREWVSPVSAPLAVRLRIAGCGRGEAGWVDTLLFLIRERG